MESIWHRSILPHASLGKGFNLHALNYPPLATVGMGRCVVSPWLIDNSTHIHHCALNTPNGFPSVPWLQITFVLPLIPVISITVVLAPNPFGSPVGKRIYAGARQ